MAYLSRFFTLTFLLSSLISVRVLGAEISCQALLKLLDSQKSDSAHPSRFAKLVFGRNPEKLTEAEIIKKLPFLYGKFLDSDFADLLSQRTRILMKPLWRTGRQVEASLILSGRMKQKAQDHVFWMLEIVNFEKTIGRWKNSEEFKNFSTRSLEFVGSKSPSLKDYQDLSFQFVNLVAGKASKESPAVNYSLSDFSGSVLWWPTPNNISSKTIGGAASLGLTFATLKKPSLGIYVDGSFVPPAVGPGVYFTHDLANHQQIVNRVLSHFPRSQEFRRIYPAGFTGMTDFRAFIASIDFFSSLTLALEDSLNAGLNLSPARIQRLNMYPFFVLWEGLEIFRGGGLDPKKGKIPGLLIDFLISRLEDSNDLGLEFKNGPQGLKISKEEFLEDIEFLIQFREQFVKSLSEN